MPVTGQFRPERLATSRARGAFPVANGDHGARDSGMARARGGSSFTRASRSALRRAAAVPPQRLSPPSISAGAGHRDRERETWACRRRTLSGSWKGDRIRYIRGAPATSLRSSTITASGGNTPSDLVTSSRAGALVQDLSFPHREERCLHRRTFRLCGHYRGSSNIDRSRAPGARQ